MNKEKDHQIKIYVMTHKAFEAPSDDLYVPLHVGKALGSDLGYLGDDTGDNISDLNPYFGELTGIYWIWKNDIDSDYIGICHYRRFFVKEDGSLLEKRDFEEILSAYDAMTTDVVTIDKTNFESYREAHHIEHLLAVKDSCKKLYPEYEKDFEAFLQDKSLCYANICVMPRGIFMKYCEWLFSILFDASENIDVSECDLYQKRVYGFLAERLLNVYVRHNPLNIKEAFVGAQDEKAETKELRYAVTGLIKQHQIDEARTLFTEVLKIRPDVALPMSDVLRAVPLMEHITYILKMEKDGHFAGMLTYSDDLSKLLSYYKKVHAFFSKDESEQVSDDKAVAFLKETNLSPVAAAVMVRGDLAKDLRQNPIDVSHTHDLLKETFSPKDYETFCTLLKS